MQRDLARDPQYSVLFKVITKLDEPILTEALGKRTVDLMREVAKADVALSTKSSFRSPLPAGSLTMEQLLRALPYENEIIACTMSGVQLRRLLDAAASDSFISGPASIDDERNYRVAATDFLASIAHRDEFACEPTKTGLLVREELYKSLTR